MDDAVDALVERYQELAPDCLRVAVRYEGDEHAVAFARDDVVEMYSPEEFDAKVKQLVVEGLADQPNQEQFRLYGEMNVVVRRFDNAVMVHFPRDEFAGVAVTFDRDAGPSLDTLADVGIDVLSTDDTDQ
ncbi:hypothetical protein ACOZ4L_13445 [Haloplanus ruber]|uniref:Roadblock/LC7 domain-containing protein n=1 Tax=Haloplanus ruber TaxID=869892 RepID=A0ABD6CY75_9EURY|nr:hypothetical protein [Haloplanus ruber]